MTYLRRRGASSRHTARVVREGCAQGWLDDRVSARLWGEQWARLGYATSAIRSRLSAKGFDEDLIQETLQRYCPASEDEERARLVMARRARHPATRLARARLARTLASRGFDSDLIERILNDS
ncbi:MAG: RecX family transcriptional regulator, partial [Candidatus Omnitrophica bacterium]|nr:RecX family transcriptional regulator [Candidatus Omnitrophota bacterium]